MRRLSWTVGTPLQGSIFSKSRVRGYGRLETYSLFIDNIHLNHNLKLDQRVRALTASSSSGDDGEDKDRIGVMLV